MTVIIQPLRSYLRCVDRIELFFHYITLKLSQGTGKMLEYVGREGPLDQIVSDVIIYIHPCPAQIFSSCHRVFSWAH